MSSGGPFRFRPTVEGFCESNAAPIKKYVEYRCTITGNRDDVDDICQEIYLRTKRYGTLDKFDPTRASLHTFVARHINNQVSSYNRKNYPKQTGLPELRDDTDRSYETVEIRKDLASYLRYLQSKKDKKYGQILRMAMTGKSRRYIASRYQITEQRISQIFKELKRYYYAFKVGLNGCINLK